MGSQNEMSDIFTKTEKAGSGSPKLLVANCIVVLIAVVSIVVFLRKDEDGTRQEKPQEDTTKEPAPKPLQPEERGDIQPEAGHVVTNSIGMKLVYIPAGSFMMGSGDSAAQLAREYDTEEEWFADEFPQHEVRISKGFWVGQTVVTQIQYESVMHDKPWSVASFVQENPNNPAIGVRWDDAMEFCRKLSRQTGEPYRLPTEAEWEYACRAGTTTRFSFGDADTLLDDYAWFDSIDKIANLVRQGYQAFVHPVGQKKPNPWGLYDMHGNVFEWCSDWYGIDYYSNSPSVDPHGPSSGETRSMRGGSSGFSVDDLRCSSRHSRLPVGRLIDVGFRVVRSQP